MAGHGLARRGRGEWHAGGMTNPMSDINEPDDDDQGDQPMPAGGAMAQAMSDEVSRHSDAMNEIMRQHMGTDT